MSGVGCVQERRREEEEEEREEEEEENEKRSSRARSETDVMEPSAEDQGERIGSVGMDGGGGGFDP